MPDKINSVQRIMVSANPRPELQSAVGTLTGDQQPRLKAPGIFRPMTIPPISPVDQGPSIKKSTRESGYHLIYGKIKSTYTSSSYKGEEIDIHL